MMAKRLIQVEVKTAEELKKFGQVGETYDIVINRLMKIAREAK